LSTDNDERRPSVDVEVERSTGLDPFSVERAEASLDAFINSRSRDKKKANSEEEMWRASERRVRAQRRQENRQSWLEYYEKMNRLHLGIAAEHADRRSRLLAEDYTGPSSGPNAPEAA
jgi:hypothetical protein